MWITVYVTILNLEGNGSFTNCSATNSGGAIFAMESQLNFSGTNVFRTIRVHSVVEDFTQTNLPLIILPGENTYCMAGSRGTWRYLHARD